MAGFTIEDLRTALIVAVVAELGIGVDEFETNRPFTDYGFDSVAALSVSTRTEGQFGLIGIPPTLLWENPTIDSLVPAIWELVNVD